MGWVFLANNNNFWTNSSKKSGSPNGQQDKLIFDGFKQNFLSYWFRKYKQFVKHKHQKMSQASFKRVTNYPQKWHKCHTNFSLGFISKYLNFGRSFKINIASLKYLLRKKAIFSKTLAKLLFKYQNFFSSYFWFSFYWFILGPHWAKTVRLG